MGRNGIILLTMPAPAETAAAAPHPSDYWAQPDLALMQRRIVDETAVRYPGFAESLRPVTELLLQPGPAAEGSMPVRDMPLYERYGADSGARLIHAVLDDQVKQATDGQRFVSAANLFSFRDCGIKGLVLGMACGDRADPRDPAEYAPIALVAPEKAHANYSLYWVLRLSPAELAAKQEARDQVQAGKEFEAEVRSRAAAARAQILRPILDAVLAAAQPKIGSEITHEWRYDRTLSHAAAVAMNALHTSIPLIGGETTSLDDIRTRADLGQLPTLDDILVAAAAVMDQTELDALVARFQQP
jgi:hypothetical protein